VTPANPEDAIPLIAIRELEIGRAEAPLRAARALEGKPAAVLDLSELHYLDWVGVDHLFHLIRGFGGKLILAGVRPQVMRLLELEQVATLLKFAPDAASARKLAQSIVAESAAAEAGR
jgi:anti-anti-sigma regulatory factor